MRRGDAGSSSILARRRCTCSLTVATSCHSGVECHTFTRICSRENTCCGAEHKNSRRSNSAAAQLDDLTAEVQLSRARVEPEIAELVHGTRSWFGDAAQHGSHASHELAWRERLDDVVVRSHLEPDDPIGLVTEPGEHDHRRAVIPVPDHANTSSPATVGRHRSRTTSSGDNVAIFVARCRRRPLRRPRTPRVRGRRAPHFVGRCRRLRRGSRSTSITVGTDGLRVTLPARLSSRKGIGAVLLQGSEHLSGPDPPIRGKARRQCRRR